MSNPPLFVGPTCEVLALPPRPGVDAPLVLERVKPSHHSELARGLVAQAVARARALPRPWQPLLTSAEFELVSERFVGVTLAEVSAALRDAGRVLPLDVLRAVAEGLFAGLSLLDALPPEPQPVPLSDAGVGLGLDGRWAWASQRLDCWLDGPLTARVGATAASPDEPLLFLPPEALLNQPPTPASTATRAALLLAQLTAGGHHPFRPARRPGEFAPSPLVTMQRQLSGTLVVPPEVHRDLPPALAATLRRALQPAGGRFESITALRASLEPHWPSPSAAPARARAVLFGLAREALHRRLASLREAPGLPAAWAGVWPATANPHAALAVVEDQLAEALVAVESLPAAGPLP